MAEDVLGRLTALIRQRRSANAEVSYTRQLMDSGPERCARKLGEEAVEAIIAGIGEDRVALAREAADLLYHLLVLLEVRGIAWDDVTGELERRMGTSGLAEKAARKEAPKP